MSFDNKSSIWDIISYYTGIGGYGEPQEDKEVLKPASMKQQFTTFSGLDQKTKIPDSEYEHGYSKLLVTKNKAGILIKKMDQQSKEKRMNIVDMIIAKKSHDYVKSKITELYHHENKTKALEIIKLAATEVLENWSVIKQSHILNDEFLKHLWVIYYGGKIYSGLFEECVAGFCDFLDLKFGPRNMAWRVTNRASIISPRILKYMDSKPPSESYLKDSLQTFIESSENFRQIYENENNPNPAPPSQKEDKGDDDKKKPGNDRGNGGGNELEYNLRVLDNSNANKNPQQIQEPTKESEEDKDFQILQKRIEALKVPTTVPFVDVADSVSVPSKVLLNRVPITVPSTSLSSSASASSSVREFHGKTQVLSSESSF